MKRKTSLAPSGPPQTRIYASNLRVAVTRTRLCWWELFELGLKVTLVAGRPRLLPEIPEAI
jgi:hypothetical protein